MERAWLAGTGKSASSIGFAHLATRHAGEERDHSGRAFAHAMLETHRRGVGQCL